LLLFACFATISDLLVVKNKEKNVAQGYNGLVFFLHLMIITWTLSDF
jgi:hypothetical protein